MGVAAAVNRFDTNFKLTNNKGRSIFIDGEQTLGLPETDVSPQVYAAWRINNKHGIGFTYFSANRVGSSFEIDRNLGGLNVTGNVEVSDKSKFYYLNYSYTFVENPGSRVRGIIGLYGLDLKLGLEAKGLIELDGETIASGRYSEDVRQLIPLPVIGIDYYFAATPKWEFGSRFALVAGKYEDTSALVIDAKLVARYKIATHVGLSLAANYFNGDIDIDEDNERKEIRYGYDGFSIGLDFNW